MLVNDALFAFPYLLLAIVAAFLLSDTIDSGIVVTAIAITVVYVPQYFRVVRASTLSAREATYIEAARAMGARPRTIIRRYLFGNVIQSVPVIATLERGRRDPDARRPRLPRPRHPAQRGGGVGLRPPARDRRRRRRHLVDGAVPGPRDRARRDRADARRRGPQRRAQPDAAAPPDRQADRPPARDRLLVGRPGVGAHGGTGRGRIDRAGALDARPAHLVRRRARRGARRRRRQPRPDARRDGRPGRRVRLRQVDARARRDRAAAGERRALRRGPLRGPQHPRPQAARICASCADRTSG